MKDKKSTLFLLFAAIIIVALIIIGVVDFPDKNNSTEDTNTPSETESVLGTETESDEETETSIDDVVDDFFEDVTQSTEELIAWEQIDLPIASLFDDSIQAYTIIDIATWDEQIYVLFKAKPTEDMQWRFSLATFDLAGSNGELIELAVPEHSWDLYNFKHIMIGADGKVHAFFTPGSMMDHIMGGAEVKVDENVSFVSWNLDGSSQNQIPLTAGAGQVVSGIKTNSDGERFCITTGKVIQIMDDGTMHELLDFPEYGSWTSYTTPYYGLLKGEGEDVLIQLYDVAAQQFTDQVSLAFKLDYNGSIFTYTTNYWTDKDTYLLIGGELYHYNFQQNISKLVLSMESSMVLREILPMEDGSILLAYQTLDEDNQIKFDTVSIFVRQ